MTESKLFHDLVEPSEHCVDVECLRRHLFSHAENQVSEKSAFELNYEWVWG